MEKAIDWTPLRLTPNAKKQIHQCIELLQQVLGKDLLGTYLYGSSILGGLQKYSDIDLFVVSRRATTYEEKVRLVNALRTISGLYMQSEELPIEITIVEKSQINPWRYPARFDFQYGEWLRKQFESGDIEPWSTKEMPDLALLVTQILLASKTLTGLNPDQLLCNVPYTDFLLATKDALQDVMPNLEEDTRNVLLTLARIWATLSTDTIHSKSAAAEWSIQQLPEEYRPVIKRAKGIMQGREKEHWDDVQRLIKPCAEFILRKANAKMLEIISSNNFNRSIAVSKQAF